MARPKSEFLSAWGRAFEIFKVIVDVVLDLGGNDEDLLRLLKDRERVSMIGRIIIQKIDATESDYFTPIPDAEVPEHHKETLAKYRKRATSWGVAATTAVCYRVRAGFTIRSHAAKMGPCVEDFKHLENLNFPDEPTSDCIVFFIPCMVPNSTSKTYGEQRDLLEVLRTQDDLSEHHLFGFGKVALLAGLILAHYKATGEQITLNGLWVRTDTCNADRRRLELCWYGGRLACSDWVGDGDRDARIGVFALGVEKVGS
ncbi:MAG: hypothetical protein Q7S48_02600 [bacterium]|nr:hypothetical protein [bacterium]